ncbi:MAG: DNA mismatch repair protein MutS [Deltaproteobacteria bacterium]|nr:DNA mismatch repair protein MutS [Deltaproteobacteria bacterium]
MFRQYRAAKTKFADSIVLFRMGDFYEMFFEDATLVAPLLGIALTTRSKAAEEQIPMCGVPHHAVDSYISRLVEAGHKVAICEQMADPSTVKGLVPREVIRVVTPGTNLDPEAIDARAGQYRVALVPPADASGPWGLAAADLTTGELLGCVLDGAPAVHAELARLEPKEILVPRGAAGVVAERLQVGRGLRVSEGDPGADDPELAAQALVRRLGEDVAAQARTELPPAAVRAAGLAVAYLASTQPNLPLPVRRVLPFSPSDGLVIDETAQAHLEILRTTRGEKRGSLLELLDRACTPMGARLLRQWVLRPLCRVDRIRRRQDAVAALVEAPAVRSGLREALGRIRDVPRLASRAVLGVASPRDLGALRDSLAHLPAVEACVAALALDPDVAAVVPPGDPCADLADELARALVPAPPLASRDGGIVQGGYSAELDELAELAEKGKDRLAELERRERDATGIASLKLRFNRVFGYYIEVTKANLRSVPADRYLRKQTIAGGERFTTQELEDLQSKILTADERRKALEHELFTALRERAAAAKSRLDAASERLAFLDVAAALAELAHERRYVRPQVDDAGVIELEESRHPVVEAAGPEVEFVPNDVRLDLDGERLWIVTGPNMAGKSTVMRQTALIVILAQMGSFVPARRARVGLVDRIFTRVGASDSLTWGQSTFMVEMTETAAILRHATRRSLVVLDEIGRGTSTFDGMSIAAAVLEHLHDVVRCRALFATHYHELTGLGDRLPGAANWNVAAREFGHDIVFLRKLVKGGASRSYGIQVARLAGLPATVVRRAGALLEELEQQGGEAGPRRGLRPAAPAGPDQVSLFAAAERSELERKLADVDLDHTTPLDALAFLATLKREAAGGK